MVPSKRELLLQRMETIFAAATGTGGTSFGRVLTEDYQGREKKGQNILSILEGPELYLEVVSPDKLDRRLEIELAAMVYVPMGTTLRAGANNALADIEEIVMLNNLWDGTAYATFLLSNLINREDTGDRSVEISVFLATQYRTKRSDPRG